MGSVAFGLENPYIIELQIQVSVLLLKVLENKSK